MKREQSGAATVSDERLVRDRSGQPYLLAAVVAVTNVGFDFVLPFLPLYITELGVADLAEAALWSGLVVGVAPLVGAVSTPFWGAIADRIGLKANVVRILFLFTALIFLMGLVTTPLQLVGLRLVFGLCGGFSALVMALISVTVPRDQIGPAMGRFQMAQAIPMAIIPVLAGWMIDRVGMRTNFVLASGLMLLAAIVFLFGYRSPDRVMRERNDADARPSLSIRQLLLQPQMLVLFSVLFAVYFVDNGLVPLFPMLVLSFHVQPGQVGTIIGIIVASGPVAMAVASLVAGRLLTGRLGPRTLIIVTLPGAVLACLGLIVAGQVLDVVLLRALLGLLFGGLTTIAFTAGTMVTPPERSGMVFGALGSAAMLGRAAGPLIAGTVASANIQMVFLLDAAVLVATLLAVVLWLHPSKRPEDGATSVPSLR